MKKTLKGLRNLEELFTEQGMAGLDYLSMSIGYDGKAYFLFSSKIPDRIDGMFVNTVANAEYTALVVSPSWESGELKKVERINLGRHVMNFRFLRPVPDGKNQFREACDELPFPPSRSRRFFPSVGLKMHVFEEKRPRKERSIY